MAREYFCAYHSYRAWMEMLTDAEKGRLFDALLAYSETGELLSLGGREAALFPAMKWNIDRDKKAYEERCETNRKNGANGSNRTRTPPTATERPPIAPQIKGKGEREGKDKGESSPPVSPSPGDTGFGKELQSAFDAWLAYKRERREPYKPTGLQSLVSEIRNNAAKYGEHAVAELIRYCMACNWRGIIFDRLKQQAKKEPPKTAQSMNDETMKYVRAMHQHRKEGC